MDLTYTPEDAAFREATRRWFAVNTPTEPLETLNERKAWHRRLYSAGYVGMLWPKEYGGQGSTPLRQAIVFDEMARVNAPQTVNNLGVGFIGPTIIVHGTEWQKQRYLRKILTAEEMWCQLYSEPNAGSDLASLRTRAEDRGDHFIVNGQKIWTSNGPNADWGILLCRTDPSVPKHRGLSCLLLNMRQPGVEVRPLKQITGMSLFAEVFMTDARAEKVDLIGQPGQGWQIAQTTLGYERGANTLGRVTRYVSAFHQLLTAARTLTRDGKPLIDNAVVRAKMGRMFAEVEVQRYAALRVLSALQAGGSPGPTSSLTKYSYTEFEKRYFECALEILGPTGHLLASGHEWDVIGTSAGEMWSWGTSFLWSRAATIYSGSSEIQKNVIGERLLGLPKEFRADRMRA